MIFRNSIDLRKLVDAPVSCMYYVYIAIHKEQTATILFNTWLLEPTGQNALSYAFHNFCNPKAGVCGLIA